MQQGFQKKVFRRSKAPKGHPKVCVKSKYLRGACQALTINKPNNCLNHDPHVERLREDPSKEFQL